MRRFGAGILAAALALCAAAAHAAKKPAKGKGETVTARTPRAALLAPEKAAARAPDVFEAVLKTTKGDVVIEVRRAWAPNGADRFYNAVRAGYYDDAAFFRNIAGFMVQFGINGSPAVNAKWKEARIPDDPAAGQSNQRGMLTFATAGPDTRTTQLFINFKDNSFLDSQGFTPFGKVVKGMEVVDRLYNGYGEGAPSGNGPEQDRIQQEGNAYLRTDFPLLDYIKEARVVGDSTEAREEQAAAQEGGQQRENEGEAGGVDTGQAREAAGASASTDAALKREMGTAMNAREGEAAIFREAEQRGAKGRRRLSQRDAPLAADCLAKAGVLKSYLRQDSTWIAYVQIRGWTLAVQDMQDEAREFKKLRCTALFDRYGGEGRLWRLMRLYNGLPENGLP